MDYKISDLVKRHGKIMQAGGYRSKNRFNEIMIVIDLLSLAGQDGKISIMPHELAERWRTPIENVVEALNNLHDGNEIRLKGDGTITLINYDKIMGETLTIFPLPDPKLN